MATNEINFKFNQHSFFLRQKYLRDRNYPLYLSHTLELNLIMPEPCFALAANRSFFALLDQWFSTGVP